MVQGRVGGRAGVIVPDGVLFGSSNAHRDLRKMLIEQMRWLWHERTTDVSGFKLNNTYASFYARLLMEREPQLRGVFELRASPRERN